MTKARIAPLVCLLVLMAAALPARAEPPLPLPRFVSVRAGEANMRTGPGDQYPIDWVYVRKGLPVEITAEFEHWRKVRDMDGAQGWMHKNLLSGQRSVVITGDVRTMRRDASTWSAAVARIEPGAVAELRRCDADWCEIEAGGRRGWLRRTEFWGVYPDERVD